MKYLGLICCFMWLVSCGSKQEKAVADTTLGANLDYATIPSFTPLTAEVDSVLVNWPSFKAFDGRVAAVRLVVSIPDLTLLVNELLEKEQTILKEGYPKDFNLPAIKSRQRLVKTYLLKIQAAIELGQNPEPAVLEFVQSFNDLKAQMNLIKAPKIDINSLTDEF